MQILAAVVMVAMLFFLWPSLNASIERSKQSEEKHWGTFAVIVLLIVGFIWMMVMSLQ